VTREGSFFESSISFTPALMVVHFHPINGDRCH
jgi:hypothetical protein